MDTFLPRPVFFFFFAYDPVPTPLLFFFLPTYHMAPAFSSSLTGLDTIPHKS